MINKATNNIFNQELISPESSVAIEKYSQSDSLLIAFGGVCGGMGMPPFEFFKLTEDLEFNKIFIRDLYQVWYHKGLPGLANDIEDIAKLLKKYIQELSCKKVLLVGTSMGGYAAIILGSLIENSVVHAFSPQTFINKSYRFWYRDRRWKSQIKNTHVFAPKRYLDLKDFLSSVNSKCQIHIHYSLSSRLDTIHAKRLCDMNRVYLHSYDFGGHLLVKHIRDSGQLIKIINEIL